MRKMSAVCKGNKAYKWFLFFLSFCMLLGSTTAHPFTVKAATSGQTDYIIRFWHADGSSTDVVTGHVGNDKELSFTINSDEIKRRASQEDNQPIEQFISFSVAAGHEAVTVDDADQSVTINYRPDVHLVKIHVFYETIKEAVGENFGTKFVEKSAEIDTRIGTEDDGDLNGKKIYNTAAGLHTEKTATPVLNGDSEDGRTFDVKLESWFAGQNAADVGLILDASGSMAFASTLDRSEEKLIVHCDEKLDTNRILNSGEVNGILNSKATDNSSLSYSDYNYYVYDDRDTTEEFVPLGYWDGKADGRHSATENAKEDLANGLVGEYHLNGDLKNDAPGVRGEAEGTWIALPENGKYSSDSDQDGTVPYATGGAAGDSFFRLFDGIGTAPQGNVLLDAQIEDPQNFTVSFAVKTNNDNNNKEEGNIAVKKYQDILYVGDLEVSSRRQFARFGNDGANALRAVLDSDNSSNAYICRSESHAFSKTEWHILTFVVNKGEASCYIDGLNKTSTGGQIGADFTGQKRVIIGGPDPYTTGVSLDVDEVYIYNRALNDAEVMELSTLSKKEIDTSGIPKTGSSYVNVSKFDEGELSKDETKRAGWYYVNSTSTVKKMESFGTAKELHPVLKSMLKKEDGDDGVGGWDESATMSGPKNDGTGEDATFEDGPEEGEGGPCLFYIDDQHFLHCIFSADNKCLWDSYVYQKSDSERIKAEELQHALGRFLVELHDASPQSYVSAVRFSTDNFKDDLSKLVMLDWTNDPAESINIMALKRGNGTFFGNDDGQYNYALTGGTYSYTGVQAFNANLKNKSHRTEEDVKAKKYLILFTDGLDDELKNAIGDEKNEGKDLQEIIQGTEAYQSISSLRDEGYTVYTVLLMGGSGSETQQENRNRAEVFLRSLASKNGGNDYFYPANTSSELEGAFNKILQSINFDLKGYTVRDTIDPRFDLVAYTEMNKETGALSGQKLIRLGANGKIRLIDLQNAGSLPETSQELAQSGKDLPEGGQSVYFKSSTQEARSAMLQWDDSNELYYLEWTNQTIPGCAVGADSLYVWDSTITLRAKDDFLGGNGVLTNGNGEKQNYVYRPGDTNASSGTGDMNGAINEGTGEFIDDDYPSKGFPRTSVNVKVLEPVMGEGEKTIYLGENIDPEAILKALGGTMDTGSFKGEEPDVFAQYPGSVYYWEYLERYAKKEGIADLIREKWFGAENPGTLEIPYFYLPNTAETNQTGSADAHEEDQIGILTYQLMDGDETGPLETSIAPYVTKDTTEKKYTLKVTYAPLQLSEEGSTAAGDGSAVRDPENKTLIKEEGKAYQTSKAPVGEEQKENKSADGTYVVKIVKGELVLKMRIKATDFSYLQEHVPKTEGQETHRIIKYAAKVERTYSTTAAGGESSLKDELGSLAGTYEASIDLDSAETYPRVTEIENGYSVEYVEVNAHLVPETNTEKGGFIAGADESETEKFREYLPIGTYTLTKDEENTVTLAPFIFNDIDKLEIDNDRDRNPMLFAETGSLIPGESDLHDYEAPDPEQEASFQLGTGGTVKPDDSIWPVTPAGLSTASAGTGATSTKEDETLADYLMDRLGIWLISGELQLGNLKISKTVDTAIDPEKKQDPTEFTFSLDLYQHEPEDESKIGEVPRLTGNYSYQIYQKSSVKGGKDETVGDPGEFDASKTIEFALKDGQYIVIEELPAGAYYTVTEQSKDGYTASIVKTAGAVAGTASIAGTAETIDGVSASGTISDNEQAEVAYTNTYRAEGELLLPVIKELTGRPWMEGDTFTFRLQTKDTNTFNAVEGGDITLPEGMDWKKYDDSYYYFDITIADSAAENSSEKKGAFNLFFHKLTSADKPYKFEISELSGSNEALTYADEKYEVEITVQEKTQKEGERVGQVVRDGKLDVLQSVIKVEDGSSEGCEEVRFVNKYAADAEVTVPVTKNIEGREWLDGEIFSFQLKAVNVDALKDAPGEGSLHFGDSETPIKSGGSYEITVGKDAKGKFKLHFANISFGEGETRKTFIFSICEVEENHPQDGLTYDKNVYRLEVVLTPGETGLNVRRTVTDGNGNEVDLDLDPVSFTNQYASSGKLMWPPVVNKTLTGRPWKDSDQFVFEMIPSETTKTAIEQGDILGPNGETLDLSSQPLQVTVNSRITANEDGSRSQAFGNLRFTKVTLPGEPYEFIIKEVIPPENSDGVDYDLVEYTVQIVVVDDNMGNLTPQVTYKKDGEPLEAGQSAAGLPFTNAYSADGSLSIPVFKELQGRNWAQGDSFTFTLSPDMDDEETKTAFDEGHICFSEDGNDPSGSVLDSIQIVIPAEGSENHEGEFRLWFRDITFAETDASGKGVVKYKFKVQEEEGDIAGIQYITDPCILMVTLTEQDGKVTAEVEAGTIPEGISFDSENGGLTFTNIYKNSGSISIPVTKVLEGRDWTDEDAFTIELAATDEAKEAVDSGKIILQADSVDTQAGTASVTITKNTSDQQGSFTIEFADLDFSGGTTPKVFEFPFVIKEVLPSQANGENPYQGVQYDITEYDLTVTVTDDGKGTLDAKVTSVTPENKAKWNQATGALELTFTNTYSESGVMEWPPKVSKTLEGRAWDASDIFTFKLTPTGDVTLAAIDDGKIVMPGNADPQDHSISVQLDQANTTKAFDNITFKAATEPEGEYEFTISEVEPEGAEDHVLNGITYSDTVYTLKVKVTSDGRGNLTAIVTEVTSSDGTVLSVPIGALPFTNTYNAAGQIEIPVTKVLTGREWLDGDRFVFTLEMPPEAQYGEDVKLPDEKQLILGKQGDIITSEGKFAPITFTKAGEYVFLVREQPGDAENLAYDTACRTVTIEVTDNGDGTLATKISKVEVEQKEEVATGNADNSADGLTFTNTYTAPTFEPVSVDLPVEKILDGRDWQEGDVFTFTLKPESDYGDAVELPGTSVSIEYAEGDNEHTAQFGPIKFKKEGTYSFTVTEEIPEGAEEPQLLMADVTSMQPLIIELPEEELEETETEETETEETETEETETGETETEETQSEETQPEETQPEGTQPEETQPEETQPEETQPEATQSEETQPEATQPEGTQPEESQPEATQSEALQPEESQPEATQSEALQPEESQPEALQSEEPQPEESQPEALQSEEPQPVESQPAEVGARFTYETVYSVEGISSELIPTSLPEDSLQDGLSETVAESSVGSEDPQEPPVETQTVLEESEAEPEEIGAGEKEEQTPFMPMGLLYETNEDGGTVKSYGVMTYSRAKYTVKVEVTADVSSGALQAVVSIDGEEWNGSDPMTFTNTYQVQQGEPETQPSEPETQPSEPETPPSEPETQPSEPETPPSEPETQPSEPESQPSEPETQPSEPETLPSEPQTPPSEPQTQPSEPQTQPAIPETSGEPEQPGVPVVQREETQSPETWEPVAIETQTETPSVDSADAMGIQNERDTGEKSAQTGDESDILIAVYVSLMVSAGSIIAAILQRRRKKDNR